MNLTNDVFESSLINEAVLYRVSEKKADSLIEISFNLLFKILTKISIKRGRSFFQDTL